MTDKTALAASDRVRKIDIPRNPTLVGTPQHTFNLRVRKQSPRSKARMIQTLSAVERAP